MKRFISILIALLLCLGLTTQTSLARAPQITVDGEEGGGGLDEGPPAIRLLSDISTVNTYGAWGAADMELVGNKLYLGSVYYDPVFDVSNPYFPRKLYEIGHINSPAHYGIEVVGDIYYAAGLWIEAWDLSDLSYLGKSDVGTLANDFTAYGGTAYTVGQVTNGSAWIDTWDISNPSNITRTGHYSWSELPYGPHPLNAHAVVGYPGKAYVGMEGLMIFNMRDPNNPVTDGSAYARNNKYGFQSVNFRDEMFVSAGPTIYKGHETLGILVYRTNSRSDKPQLGGIIAEPAITPPDLCAFEVVGNLLFLCTSYERKFKVVDINDVTKPKVLASVNINEEDIPPFSGAGLEIEVDTQRGLAFVVAGESLLVYDISDFLE